MIPAGAGSIALTALWAGTMADVEPIWAAYGLEGAERVLMMACYTPLLLWGPLLAAVTISYHRRHRRTAPDAPSDTRPGPARTALG